MCNSLRNFQNNIHFLEIPLPHHTHKREKKKQVEYISSIISLSIRKIVNNQLIDWLFTILKESIKNPVKAMFHKISMIIFIKFSHGPFFILIEKVYTYTLNTPCHVWIEHKRGVKFNQLTISIWKSNRFQAIQPTNCKAFQRKM